MIRNRSVRKNKINDKGGQTVCKKAAEKINSSKLLFNMFVLAAGVLIITAVAFFLTAHDTVQAVKASDQALAFMKARTVRFSNYAANDRTKSLIRLLDKTSELSRCIAVEDMDVSDLDRYAYDQRLTGVALLDGDFDIIEQSSCDGDIMESWSDMILSDNVANIAHNELKSYMTRVEKNGVVYDFAAVPRTGADGIVIAYAAKDEIDDGGDITADSLISGFDLEMNGIGIISDGSTVISSTYEELQGKGVDEYSGMLDNGLKRGRNGLIKASFQQKIWYGNKMRAGKYILYVFFPSASVFSLRNTVVGYAVVIYIMICLIFMMLKYRNDRGSMMQIQKQYRTIEAISGIYTAVFVLRLDDGSVETIKVPDEIKRKMHSGLTVQDLLNSINADYVSEQFREDYMNFADMATVGSRLQGQSCLTFVYEDIYNDWYMTMLIPQRYNEYGSLKAVLMAMRNVTDDKKLELDYQERLRRAAQEAERANIAKTDFLRRMSHDIRTPINGIRGMVDISRFYKDDQVKQEECRNKIMLASSFLLDLVNSVLDMNKLESGEVKLEEKPFRMSRLLKETSGVLEMQARECGITLNVCNEADEHDYLIGSPVHLGQVLQNIIGNAIKYNNDSGTVDVTCREISYDGNTAGFEFVCADTGIGMSEEFQQHAFEPFAQENESARTSYAGTGLGLPITKELVEQMGGSISFKSAPGEGTEFRIVIPFVIDTEEKPDEAALNKPDDLEMVNGAKILVVEDNDLNMEIVEFVLRNHGVDIVKAWNGREGVDIFASSSVGEFDMILMDVMMPVMNGINAARAIRALNRADAATVPIIAMTANAFTDDREASAEAGMNEHLAKPLNADELMDTVRKYYNKEEY